WEEKMLTGLNTYKEKNGNVLVLYPFTVPVDDASWPQAFRGYRLGNAVAKLRTKVRKDLVSASMLEELERMDFALNVTQFKWDRIVLPSLRQFYKVLGHLYETFSLYLLKVPKNLRLVMICQVLTEFDRCLTTVGQRGFMPVASSSCLCGTLHVVVGFD
ncbi:hypothetical protein PHMEG_00031157, partial [Phytophthora megakarya]